MADSVNVLRRLAWRGVAALPRPVRELAYLPVRRRADAELRALAPMPPAGRRLYIGPANTAGAAWEWARAVERHLPDTAAQNLFVQRSASQAHFGYPADHTISVLGRRGHVRQVHGARVLEQSTHVLFESGFPVLDDFYTGSALDDLEALRAAGIAYAGLYHGSELRDLRQHAERYEHSPFRVPEREWDDYFRTLQSIVEHKRSELDRFDGPLLVPTPDMLDVLPEAAWVPLIADVDRFSTDAPVLERRRPVVLHAPSNPTLKGTPFVERVLTALQDEGLLVYRRLTGVPHERMAAFIADADVVVDQIVLGNPATLAAECWAARRLVVAHLPERVRARMRDTDAERAEVPVVEADPSTFEDVMREIAAHPSRFRETAEAGAAWARRNHDGARSAAVLDSVLLSRPGPGGSPAPGDLPGPGLASA